MPELREALSDAFDKVEADTSNTTAEPKVSEPVTKTENESISAEKSLKDQKTLDSEAKQRERDEKGRFAAKQAAEAAVQAPGQAQLPLQTRPTPPSSWKKELQAHWEKLDPEVASYINQREQDFRTGIGKYMPDAEYGRNFKEVIKPYEGLIQSIGLTPDHVVRSLLSAEQQFRFGSNEQKLQLLNKIINDYGININGFQPQQISPDFAAMRNEVTQLRAGFSQYQEQQKRERLSAIEHEIEAFRVDKPHFETVQDTMIQILQSGMAQDLSSAYDKAIRLHPDIFDSITRERLLSEEQKKRAEADKAAKAAKAKAVGVKGSTPNKPISDSGKQDRRSLISNLMDDYDARV